MTGASINGVEPSWRVTTGSSGSSGRRSRYRSMSGRGLTGTSHELFLDDPDRARRRPQELERGDLLQRREEPRLGSLVHHHHQAGVVPEAALDHATHRYLVAAEHVGDGREDARAVRDLQMQVEGRWDVADDLQALVCGVHRRLAGDD